LDKLHLPLLTKLSLSLEDSGSGNEFDIQSFPCLPSLRSLTVSNDAISAEDILSLLHASPGLIELEVNDHACCFTLLELLTCGSDGMVVYLSRLQKIISRFRLARFSPHTFLKMINPRWSADSLPSVSRPQEVTLFVSTHWGKKLDEAKAALQEYRSVLNTEGRM
jgi:hypothetical protein